MFFNNKKKQSTRWIFFICLRDTQRKTVRARVCSNKKREGFPATPDLKPAPTLCLLCSAGAANHHSQSTLRPPLPPPHNHHTLSHQSANSLNRNTLRGGRNPIHAPAPGPGDGPTTPESVQLQDSWVLNSNVPLETRSVYRNKKEKKKKRVLSFSQQKSSKLTLMT